MTVPSPSSSWTQWNVRLPPDLSSCLREHLADPLLVGLPRGAVASFFITAVINELERRKCPFTPSTSKQTVDFF